MFAALLHALLDRGMDFYPRLSRPEMTSLKPDSIVPELAAAMAQWKPIDPSDKDVDKALELARYSLQEVKAQTEYQDQKAARLLTVTTFLTALAGALFATFSSNYPLRYVASIGTNWSFVLAAAYLAFLLFILSSLAGALVTFHATRTRFKYPSEATDEKQAGPTRSFLFFREIVGVSPAGWAGSFPGVRPDGKASFGHLKAEYLKNYVAETYLIAAKTADKLRYLQPAQSLLAWALRFLLVYLTLLAVIQVSVRPVPSNPTKVTLVPAAPAR